MKKLIMISAFALAMVSSCQNSNNEQDPTIQNVEAAKEAIKLARNPNEAGRTHPGISDYNDNTAVIDCHTNYSKLIGHACVWSNGQLFNVSWVTSVSSSGGVASMETTYTATQTSFCNC